MMKINCISCGHNVNLGDVYDDYEGPVKCFACSALLGIKTEEGQIKTIKILKNYINKPLIEKAAKQAH